MFFICGVVISLILHLACGVIVRTKYVAVSGNEVRTSDGTTIYRFLGIPYAYPPTGELRFKEPVPISHNFESVWDASFNVKCLQYKVHSSNEIEGQEDCLFLNVYTTSIEETANYDVIVLIHGGKFYFGYSDEETPYYLFEATKRLVFVSINYRLGPFGFLSTEDDVVPGNNGLKDQVVALKWVQENISRFGGNPARVTIAGMNAGGVSVHLHYMSPMSKDLFAQGISMSGSALSLLVKTKNVRKEAEDLAALVRCPTASSADMVACLRRLDGFLLLQKSAEVPIPMREYNSYYMHFGPVVEKGGSNPFLNEDPFSILRKGQVKNAPWLVSTPRAEGYVSASSLIDKLPEMNSNWNTIAPMLLRFNDLAPTEKLPQISQRIWSEYFQGSPITRDNANELCKLIGDRLYLTSVENAIRLHATASNAPVYFYTFDYVGGNGYNNKPTGVNKNFVDDYRYVLRVEGFEPPPENRDMIKTMVQVWQSYAETGVPDAGNGVSWPTVQKNRITNGDLTYVKIIGPSEIKSVSSPSISKRLFWSSLPLDEPHITDIKESNVDIVSQPEEPHKKGIKESNPGIVSRQDEPQITDIKQSNPGFVSRFIFNPVLNIFSIFLKTLKLIFISPFEMLFNLSSSKSNVHLSKP